MAPLRETEPGNRRVERYGAGGFRILGDAHRGSILLLPQATLTWPVTLVAEVTIESLEPLIAAKNDFQFVLIGLGPTSALLPQGVRVALTDAGIRYDLMDTGAACRTYNVLVAEDRPVAAALIAVE